MPDEIKVTHGKEPPFIWSEIDSFCIFFFFFFAASRLRSARLAQPSLGTRQMLVVEFSFSESLCIFFKINKIKSISPLENRWWFV